MANKFPEHGSLNLTEVNHEILEQWDREDLFHRSISEREGCPSFVFFEGPPSANGHPGIHHVLARSIKDTFCRFKTMKGFQVHRKAGWDTHGLPVELGVEKELGITKEDIGKTISIDDYNRRCRQNVMMFTSEWEDLSRRMGYWVDMEHPYITYDNKYIETLWWLLKQLYQKGLLYKGYTIQPYSPAAGTGLSSHELNQPGCYRDVKDTTVTAQFKLKVESLELIVNDAQTVNSSEGNLSTLNSSLSTLYSQLSTLNLPVYILAWTTTPWTLPSNTALCVGPKIEYVAVKGQNPYTKEEAIYILAKARKDVYFPCSVSAGSSAGKEDAPASEVIAEFMGSDLLGLRYEQLFPWVKPCALEDGKVVVKEQDAFRVIPGDYVTTEDGTGIVHIAPTFGADDAKVAKDAGIPSLFVIDKAGDTRPMVDFTGKYFVGDDMDAAFVEACVRESYWHHAGDFVKNAYDPQYAGLDEKALAKTEDLNIVLCMEMKQEGTAFKIEKHVHNYPHCWRTDKPILYYPLDSWFIRSTAAKERMMELNKTILWKPESTGTGRFGKWLENLNDWNLSRSRYWGTPLPIWRNRDTREEVCIGSVEELYNEIEKSVRAGVMAYNPLKDKGFVPGDMSQENYDRIDLHRPYVDEIVLVGDSGAPLRRELDLIDVWFDSGAMPYAQIHYPFENAVESSKLKVDSLSSSNEQADNCKSTNLSTFNFQLSTQDFPADFIAEGVDQTRGWFFTLHAIATMVFDSVSYKAVISNGLVLDKNGLKMSKRLGNAINPFDNIEKFGSDAVRWYMLTNSQPWDNLKYDEAGVQEVARSFFGKLYQTYSFLAMYANVDGWHFEEAEIPMSQRSEMDRWILSSLNSLIRDVEASYENYEPTRAGRLIQSFVIDNVSNWFVRLSRKRFWGGEMTIDKLSAYQTLYTCLETVSRLMAPIAPFYADRLFRDLHGVTVPEGSSLSEAAKPSAPEGSVHLATFPEANDALIDKEQEARMELAQQITSMVLSLRKKEQIIVRQPLARIAIPAIDREQQLRIEAVKQLILDEVNVKALEFVEGAGLLTKKVKCNFRTMGKKFGKLMKDVNAAVTALTQEQIAILETGQLSLTLPMGDAITVELEDVEIFSEDIPGWTVANDGALTVALDITVTNELRNEGIARELVKRIQNLRKESGFEITDRITVQLTHSPETDQAVQSFESYISSQVLADSICLTDELVEGVDLDIEGVNAQICIRRTN